MSGPDGELELERLEAYEEISQLAARYALAFDQRDVDTLVALFVDDVVAPDGGVGREALSRWLAEALRGLGISIHLVGGHQIELTGATTATGIVTTRAEYQVGDRWVVVPLQHWDRYERREQGWRFARREWHAFYAADLFEDPGALPGRFDLAGHPLLGGADIPEAFPTWRAFWGDTDDTDEAGGSR